MSNACRYPFARSTEPVFAFCHAVIWHLCNYCGPDVVGRNVLYEDVCCFLHAFDEKVACAQAAPPAWIRVLLPASFKHLPVRARELCSGVRSGSGGGGVRSGSGGGVPSHFGADGEAHHTVVSVTAAVMTEDVLRVLYEGFHVVVRRQDFRCAVLCKEIRDACGPSPAFDELFQQVAKVTRTGNIVRIPCIQAHVLSGLTRAFAAPNAHCAAVPLPLPTSCGSATAGTGTGTGTGSHAAAKHLNPKVGRARPTSAATATAVVASLPALCKAIDGSPASLLREVGSFLQGFRWYIVWMQDKVAVATGLTKSLEEEAERHMGNGAMDSDLDDTDSSGMDAAFAYVFSDDDDDELTLAE